VEVAKHFDTSVLSADSRQFYKEISIGTAKPSKEEQDGVPHYFIDSHYLENEITSAQFETMGLQVLDEIYQSKDFAILTGGSGMFVDALCVGLDNIPTNAEVKKQVILEYELDGLAPLLIELQEKDPIYFQEVDRENAMRIQRAIEAIRITGAPFSSLRQKTSKSRPFQIHYFVLNHDREKLYARINQRVETMMKKGLEDEVISVQKYRNLTSMNTVGYKELFAYLDGEITKDRAVELIKQNSRRYAKRQLTWLRRNPEYVWIDFTNSEEVVQQIISHVKKNS